MPFRLSERASGVLLHPTSLPGPRGCGDLGPAAQAFARALGDAGQGWWQMLPVGPVGYGNSPCSAQSAFAGEPLLLSVEWLVEDGLLPKGALKEDPPAPPGRVDYAGARAVRERHLRAAFSAFARRTRDHARFELFCAENAAWLDNDTTAGWFHDQGSPRRPKEECESERRAALACLGVKDGGREIHRDMIRGVWSSVANLAIAPAQDLLGLSSPARMNRPGTTERNWEWRLPPPIAGEALLRLRELTRIYGRSAR